jgi:ankyrin repeat protein
MTIAVSDCPGAIELLLASGVDINEQTRLGPPLVIAARNQWSFWGAVSSLTGGQAEWQYGGAVKALIEKGADPNARDDAGRNALMTMSLERHAVIDDEMIFERRGTIESRRLARRNDKAVESIGETLLNAGCDVNAADNEGRTPLIYAVASERPNVVELLLKRSANIKAKDYNGESSLDWAIKFGNDEIIRLLSSLSSSGGEKTSR